MERSSLSTELFNIAHLLAEALDAVAAECNIFLKKFPQNLSFDTDLKMEDTADLITAYYLQTAAICRIVEQKAEPLLVSVSEFMRAVDQRMQSDLVVQSDMLLERFLEFRTALNEYLRKNNEILQPGIKTIDPTEIKKDTRALVHRTHTLAAYLQSFTECPNGKRNHL